VSRHSAAMAWTAIRCTTKKGDVVYAEMAVAAAAPATHPLAFLTPRAACYKYQHAGRAIITC
jgi:hypothetical protein